ncbi:class I SAM-dependent methyltransferase [Desulfoplanes sp.]
MTYSCAMFADPEKKEPLHEAQTRIARVLTGHTGLNIMHAESLGLHYAATLVAWRKRFQDNLDRIRDLGFDDRFVRKWLYYLVSCEEGFRSGHVNDYQFVMARPGEQRRRSA